MKLLVDMNLSPRWIEFLQKANLEAIHWSTVGKHDAPDVEIMGYAKANGYIVLTHDLDFGAILAATHGTRPSVVQIRTEEVNPAVIGNQLVSALQQMEFELDEGALLTIDTNRTRIRVLPLFFRE